METKETEKVVDSLNQEQHEQQQHRQQQQQQQQQQARSADHVPMGNNKSVTLRPDGSVLVEILSPTEENPNAVQQLEYPNQEAAQAAGHTVETFEDEAIGKEEIIEEEIMVIEDEDGEHTYMEEEIMEEEVVEVEEEEGGDQSANVPFYPEAAVPNA
jgi:hypothetical protein